MTCEPEKQLVVETKRQRLTAAYNVRLETMTAELDVSRFNAHIYDWRALRLSEAIRRCWDSRCAQAEDALQRCKENERNRNAVAQSN